MTMNNYYGKEIAMPELVKDLSNDKDAFQIS